MSGDPFAGLTHTIQERKELDSRVRKQRWIAFLISLGAIVLIAAATGVGGGLGGWAIERDSGNVLDRFLGGLTLGLAGGVFYFLLVIGRYMRKSVVKEVRGEKEKIDIAAVMFWGAIAGTAIFGIRGATVGYSGKVAFDLRVMGCSIAAVLLALIPVTMLRKIASRKSRSGSGSTTFKGGN
jgi:hypothetical protein